MCIQYMELEPEIVSGISIGIIAFGALLALLFLVFIVITYEEDKHSIYFKSKIRYVESLLFLPVYINRKSAEYFDKLFMSENILKYIDRDCDIKDINSIAIMTFEFFNTNINEIVQTRIMIFYNGNTYNDRAMLNYCKSLYDPEDYIDTVYIKHINKY